MKNFVKTNWLTFTIVSIVIFTKNLLFHYSCFGYLAFSSLWNAPIDFFAFYFAKLSPAIFIASFVFLVKRKWWLIPVCVLLDMWLIADLIYFRANGFFLDADTIAMIGNMEGFWSSIVAYINWPVFVLLCTTILLGIYLLFTRKLIIQNSANKEWRSFAIVMVVVVIFGLFDWFCGYRNTRETSCGAKDGWKYNFITASKQTAMGNNPAINSQWIEAQSPMHFFPALLFSYAYGLYYHSSCDVSLTEPDKNEIAEFLRDKTQLIPDYNLIIIVGESFESWVIGLDDEEGDNVVPNMTKYANTYNCLYCSKIKSQVRAGTSGDGQMIINTGLLPISSGAACITYGDNAWPNIAGNIYTNGYVVNPCVNVWNQKQMTEKYGYRYNIQCSAHKRAVGDSAVFAIADKILDTCSKPFCMQIITETTHTPFDCGGRANMHFPAGMPDNLRNYLNCMHYADSCIGQFLDKLEKDSLFDNTTILITGDHTIFKKSLLLEYQQFAQKYNYPVPAEESYCPLLILSPKIKGNMKIDELCYQMDIYPTIINLVGEEGYGWKGFGVNLMDSVARHNRPITEADAYILSDKIIRSNYFKEIMK